MSPDDEAALVHARQLVVVTDIVHELTHHDCLNSACGLATIAKMMVANKPAESTALAMHLIRTALELDPHIANVKWQ
jgi:hypothetical protein